MINDRHYFEEAKSALLSHYSEQQVSQGARLIGFAVALFTLVQTVQSTHDGGLSVLFPFDLGWSVPGILKLPFLFAGIFILMTFIVRTIFRYAAMAYLVQCLIELSPVDVAADQSYQTIVQYRATEEFLKSNAKLYGGIVKATQFVKTERPDTRLDYRQGWKRSIVIAVVLTSVLIWLLW